MTIPMRKIALLRTIANWVAGFLLLLAFCHVSKAGLGGGRTDFKTAVSGGTVIRVDALIGIVVIKEAGSGEERSFIAGDIIDVHVNGHDTTFDDVKPGMRAKIIYYKSDNAIKSLIAISAR
jgi:hypothetical protein